MTSIIAKNECLLVVHPRLYRVFVCSQARGGSLEVRHNAALGDSAKLIKVMLRQTRLVAPTAFPALIRLYNGGAVVLARRIDKLVRTVLAVFPARS